MSSLLLDDDFSRAGPSSTPDRALMILPQVDTDMDDNELSEWRPILSDSHQVVLYNSNSHALSVQPHPSGPPSPLGSCPYCHRPLDTTHDEFPFFENEQHTRASNYFQLLEIANETSSRPSSRQTSNNSLDSSSDGLGHIPSHAEGFKPNAMAEGYFEAFFKEECRLGMGANGSVYLCQHVLDDNPLGRFAVKKIAVGQSHAYLIQILREVRLLERLRHPNIITYHHAWLETHQFSSFGPKVPTLFVLMQWAEGGSLDDFIDGRLGRKSYTTHPESGSPTPETDESHSRSARIRAFRTAQAEHVRGNDKSKPKRSNGTSQAVHLLSAEEARRLFSDVVSGLAFLHDKSILHLDLKPGNVLLTWDEDALIPRAMLSDFGTSRDMIQPSKLRTGNTGTLEYTAPEALLSPQTGLLAQVDSKADMWSLGMILHMLIFFRLPYHHSSDGSLRQCSGGDMAKLEKEVQEYLGFRRTPTVVASFERRGLSGAYIYLLESLLNRLPKKRPSSEQVLRAIREGNLDPIPIRGSNAVVDLVPRAPQSQNYPDQFVMESPYFDAEIDGEQPVDDDDGLSGDDRSDASTPTRGISEKDRPPMLALPPTPPSPETRIRHFIRPILLLWTDLHRWTQPVRPAVVRVVKSVVLATKVFSLLSLCPNGRPDLRFTCFMLGLAVSDTWSDDLKYTAFLGITHAVILRLYCPGSNCCI